MGLLQRIMEDVAESHRLLQIPERCVDAAGADANLSPQGKQDGAAKAGRVAIAALDAFTSTTIGGLESQIALVEAAIMPAPKPSTDLGDRIVAELRAQEIRRQFAPLDPLERTYVYLDTADPEIRAALESAPPSVSRARPGDMPVLQPFIDDARKHEQVLARAEARDPTRAAELRDLQQLARVYRSTVATARTGILEAVPSLRPDPIAAGE